ncbi:amino acid aminotransferase [Paraferrimonas sedimenticola]|uniref:Aminotransferase n=1 Tax=Paraferrimonas sedimenticola TaxID=375674 RepID=A0AA37VVK5_9GAMM|nr:amino acid aminotransferase [Paraferrimonas sedimenticola]GLP96116.1 aminotransferase [Paraferrimonas sedimenticola]
MLFSAIEQAPADPILGLTEAFKADPRSNKINLGVGIYKNEAGQTPVLDSVKRAETALLEQVTSKSYLGIEGVPAYAKAVQALLFGSESALLKDNRVFTAQAPGGTGSLRVAAEFLNKVAGANKIWVSNPTWANHSAIFQAAGLEVASYSYYDKASHGLNFDGMVADLEAAKAGDVLLVHGCCHNPTGIDLNLDQWKAVAELCLAKGLVPLFDFAYQGFAKGIDEDAAGLRLVAEHLPEVMVANSFSKNFGLYNERIGAVSLIASNQEEGARAFSQVKRLIRGIYSNPPAHGALIVSHILNDAELTALWHSEVAEMRDRIQQMRTIFVSKLGEAGIDQDFSFIERQNGMFSFSGLTPEQVAQLKDEHGIYIVGSGRISVAGMTLSNMDNLVAGIKAVL